MPPRQHAGGGKAMVRATRFEAAAFGGPIEPRERDLPAPQGREVIVAVSHCGVCHTDLHVHHGGYSLGGGRELRFEDRGVNPPLVLGHEIVGRVAEAGPDAGPLPEGPVAVYPWIGCGACFRCEAGEDHLCASARFLGVFAPGGYASHVTVPDPRYLFDIGDIDPAVAALFGCSGLTCFTGLKKLAHLPDKAGVMVIGAGGLGQTALALARQMGRTNLVAIDTSAEKRDHALTLGARAAFDPADATPGALAEAAGGPLLAALDLVGSEATAALATAALDKGGMLVVIGLFGGEFRYPLPLMPIRALTVAGSYVGGLADMAGYIAHVRAHGAPRIPIDTKPMAQAANVLAALGRGEIAGRTVLVNEARGGAA